MAATRVTNETKKTSSGRIVINGKSERQMECGLSVLSFLSCAPRVSSDGFSSKEYYTLQIKLENLLLCQAEPSEFEPGTFCLLQLRQGLAPMHPQRRKHATLASTTLHVSF